MKQSIFLFSFTTIILLSMISSHSEVLNHKSKSDNFLYDTIPGMLITYDTSIVFDPATYVETVTVTKNEVKADSYFSNLIFSGKSKNVSDTIYLKDSSSEELKDISGEGIIKIIFWKMPIEILYIYNNLNDAQKDAVRKTYGIK